MGRRERFLAPTPDIEQVRELVEQWRKTRTNQTRMPEEIWTALVPLARAHGVYGVAKRLGVNYQALKKRVASSSNKGGLVRAPRARFVDMGPGLSMGPASTGTVVELVGAAGERLTVRLGSTAGLDVTALMREFWSRAV
jgi:hypothetical protein